MKVIIRAGVVGAIGVGMTGAAGCTGFRSADKILAPTEFVAPTHDAGDSNLGSVNPIDKPGPILYNDLHMELLEQGNPREGSAMGISKTVREAVRPPDEAVVGTQPATLPENMGSTAPQTQTNGDQSGKFEVVDAVLAEVNGTPIYADKVLAVLDRALSAEARKRDATDFQNYAADLIGKQVSEFIHNELEFAAAQRNLGPKETELARALTVEWRVQQINKAGGSLQMAKRAAAEDGTDFEETVREHYRWLMTQLYYQRHVFPLIRVSPSDMRNYYERNLQKQFTKQSSAQFRVIRISIEANQTRERALEKARQIRKQAVSGDDFATLATKDNDDPNLAESGGRITSTGWVDKGAYAVQKVEKALWEIQPGQITDVIDTGDAFYIAKLEAVTHGKVESFESEEVQDRIRDELRREQFNQMRDSVREALQKKAVIRTNDTAMETALAMVMQKYVRWTAPH